MTWLQVFTMSAQRIWAAVNLQALRSTRRAFREMPTSSPILVVASGLDYQESVGGRFMARHLSPWIKSIDDEGRAMVMALHPLSASDSRPLVGNPIRVDTAFMMRFARMMSRPNGAIGKSTRAPGDAAVASWSLPERIRDLMWEWALGEIQPRAVIGIGLDRPILNQCQRLAIPTIEVQHGLWLSDGSTFQEYWPGVGEQGRLKPDLLCAWDESYSKLAESHGLSAIACGYQPPLVHSACKRVASHSGSSVATVCSLQVGLPNAVDQFGMVSGPLHSAIQELVASGMDPILRVHPVAEARIGIRSVRDSLSSLYGSMRVESSLDRTTADALAHVDCHLTHASATVVDAASLGVPSVVTGDLARLSFPPRLMADGLLVQARPGHLANQIQVLARSHPVPYACKSTVTFSQALWQAEQSRAG